MEFCLESDEGCWINRKFVMSNVLIFMFPLATALAVILEGLRLGNL